MSQIAGALRLAVNRTTGFTPNMMRLGREVLTPAQLRFPVPEREVVTPKDYVSQLQERMQRAHAIARKKVGTAMRIW